MPTLRRAPNHWELAELLESVKTCSGEVKIGNITHSIPARPEGFFSLQSRWRLAKVVFQGKADAVYWPEDRIRE